MKIVGKKGITEMIQMRDDESLTEGSVSGFGENKAGRREIQNLMTVCQGLYEKKEFGSLPNFWLR